MEHIRLELGCSPAFVRGILVTYCFTCQRLMLTIADLTWTASNRDLIGMDGTALIHDICTKASPSNETLHKATSLHSDCSRTALFNFTLGENVNQTQQQYITQNTNQNRKDR